MAKFPDTARTRASVLDRLSEDGDSADPTYSVAQFKRVVARDLENLLNTRQELLQPEDDDYPEVNHSILRYGLPDFSALNIASASDRNQVRRAVDTALATFEPRIERVRVSVDEPRPNDRGLRFRIEAVLRAEPVPLTVTFDAMLEARTQQYEIKEG